MAEARQGCRIPAEQPAQIVGVMVGAFVWHWHCQPFRPGSWAAYQLIESHPPGETSEDQHDARARRRRTAGGCCWSVSGVWEDLAQQVEPIRANSCYSIGAHPA